MGHVTASSFQPGAPGPDRNGRDPRRPFASSAFSRLARTHALSVGGDALFAISLAGSVFFSLDFNSARPKVALYLLLTIAPFAVAAPLIGPALDRISGGRRWVIFGSVALRAVLCFFVIRHMDSLLFYPEAFLMLVLGKTYTISKSAVVPTTVRSDQELIEANSKLTVLSALAVVVVAPFGGALLHFGGPGWALALAMVLFAVGAVMALQIPSTQIATTPAGEAEREELRSRGIRLAASAMGLVRGIVGFLSFMLAFSFKAEDAPLWHLGLAAGAAQLGFFVGAIMVPKMRRVAEEERILIANLAVAAVGGLACAVLGGLLGAIVLSLLIGATSSAAKQAFDAIVQQDAPDANRGRSFAKFETRFQLFWVVGALIPIVISIPAEIGFLMVSLVATFATISYMVSRRRLHRAPESVVVPPDAERPSRVAPPEPSLSDLTTVSDDRTEVRSPPLDPDGANPRRWASRRTRSTTEWSPPDGFVEQPLADEEVFEGAGVDPSIPRTRRPGAPFDDLAEPTTIFTEEPRAERPRVEQPQAEVEITTVADLDEEVTRVADLTEDEVGTPPLPFDEPGGESADEPTHVYPDPPWRSG